MKLFDVYGPSPDAGPDQIQLIPEGFLLVAYVLNVGWMAYHRMWRVMAGFVALCLVLGFVLWQQHIAELGVLTCISMVGLLLGYCAADLRAWELRRKGYMLLDVAVGHDEAEAERVFLMSRQAHSKDIAVKTVAIVDYGSGNLRSAAKAFERSVAELGRTDKVLVTSDPQEVLAADHIVLPGVGAFGDCAAGLRAVPGMVAALEQAVLQDKKPFLGICVGMQLLAERGLEHGTHDGLGWIAGDVAALTPSDASLKIPHMGWNDLRFVGAGKTHPVLAGLRDGQHAYFVHSFGFRPSNADHILAVTDYGGDVVAVLGRDNIVGVQFHPEKSQDLGLQLIRNFLGWDGR